MLEFIELTSAGVYIDTCRITLICRHVNRKVLFSCFQVGASLTWK